jgi:hypothetical protein
LRNSYPDVAWKEIAKFRKSMIISGLIWTRSGRLSKTIFLSWKDRHGLYQTIWEEPEWTPGKTSFSSGITWTTERPLNENDGRDSNPRPLPSPLKKFSQPTPNY